MTAFDQWRVSGGINLYHVSVGSQTLSVFGDQDDSHITAWRRDAHLPGTHILSYQVRRYKLKSC